MFLLQNQYESNHSCILSLACIHYSLPTPHVWFFRKKFWTWMRMGEGEEQLFFSYWPIVIITLIHVVIVM